MTSKTTKITPFSINQQYLFTSPHSNPINHEPITPLHLQNSQIKPNLREEKCNYPHETMGRSYDHIKQFSTQGLDIQLELCVVQIDLEVLQQIGYVFWQPKTK